jgi:hypothetical protein
MLASGDAVIEGCTIIGNSSSIESANGFQSGIYVDSTNAVFRNTIIHENTANLNGVQVVQNLYINALPIMPDMFQNVCMPQGYPLAVLTNGCIDADPCLNSDYTLSAQSPCIAAGNNAFTNSAVDLEGHVRIQYATVDIGCFESSYETPLLTDDADGDGIPDSWETTWFDSVADCDPAAHDDGDIFSNFEEYIAGTCPTNTDSCFLITNQVRTVDGIELQWAAVPDRVYGVEWTESLTNDFQSIAGLTNLTASSCIVTNGDDQGFFRLTVKIGED